MSDGCKTTVWGLRVFVTLLAGLMLGACSSTPSPRYYLLESPTLQAASSTDSASALRVGVGSFEVAPPYDRDGVAYRPADRGAEIGFYRFHRWAVPLGQEVPRALAAALDRQPGIEATVGPSEGAAVLIEGRVVRMEEVDTSAGVFAEMELEVLWSPGGDGAASSATTLVVTEPVAERTVTAVVEAMAVALERAAGDLAKELR